MLELTFNHDGRSYDLGTGYGHVAIGVDDLDATLERLAGPGDRARAPPYPVRQGGSRLCFVQRPGRLPDRADRAAASRQSTNFHVR